MSSQKWQRYYQLMIQGKTKSWTISYPMTCRFEIDRNILASCNSGRITLYNLPPEVRSDIFFDRMASFSVRPVQLLAGHINAVSFGANNKLPPPILTAGGSFTNLTNFPPGALIKRIFNGNIKDCWSERRGPDWVTTIEGFDGGTAIYSPQSNISVTLNAPWTGTQAVKALVGTMQGVSLGNIGTGVSIPGDSNRGKSFCGDAWQLLQDLVKTSKAVINQQELSAYAYIDDRRVNVAMPTDLLVNRTLLLQGAIPPSQAGSKFTYPTLNSGIIGVPKRKAGIVEVEMLLTPEAEVGQQANLHILLVSRRGLSTGFDWNGNYQIVGVRHSGTISAAFDGGAFTTLSLWDPSKYFAATQQQAVPA